MSDKDLQNPRPSLPGDVKTTGSAPFAFYRDVRYDGSDDVQREYNGINEFSGGGTGFPLYAAPASPAASVLSDEQISAIVDEFDACHWVDGECRIEGREMMKLCRTLLAASMGGEKA